MAVVLTANASADNTCNCYEPPTAPKLRTIATLSDIASMGHACASFIILAPLGFAVFMMGMFCAAEYAAAGVSTGTGDCTAGDDPAASFTYITDGGDEILGNCTLSFDPVNGLNRGSCVAHGACTICCATCAAECAAAAAASDDMGGCVSPDLIIVFLIFGLIVVSRVATTSTGRTV
jgi:hypothetical protein